MTKYKSGTPCFICKESEACFHHLKSRGASGPDEPWNLLPLCKHHHVEIHNIGLREFADRYVKVKAFLNYFGWQWCEIRQKYFYPIH